jgi:Na+/H+-translocating membrane pyrophosphatase
VIVITLALAASGFLFTPAAQVAHFFGDMAPLWNGASRGLGFLIGALSAVVIGMFSIQLVAQASTHAIAAAQKGYVPVVHVSYGAGSVVGVMLVALVALGGGVAVSAGSIYASEPLLAMVLGGLLATLLLTQTAKNASIHATKPAETAVFMNKEGQVDETALAHFAAGIIRDSSTLTAWVYVVGLLLFCASFISGVCLNYDVGNPSFAFFVPVALSLAGVAAFVGNSMVRTSEERRNARASMSKGVWVSAGVGGIGSGGVLFLVLGQQPGMLFLLLALFVGVILALALERIIFTFAPAFFNPYKKLDRTTLLAGMIMGRLSMVWAGVFLVAAIVVAILAGGSILSGNIAAVGYSFALVGLGLFFVAGTLASMDMAGTIAHYAHILSLGLPDIGKNARNTLEDLRETGAMIRGLTRGILAGLVVIGTLALAGALYAAFLSTSPIF